MQAAAMNHREELEQMVLLFIRQIADQKGIGYDTVTFVDFFTNQQRSPEYQKLLALVARDEKTTNAKLERTVFDTVKKEFVKRLNYGKLEMVFKEFIYEFLESGYDYEDITVNDIKTLINKQPITEKAREANEEIDRIADIEPRAFRPNYSPEETAIRNTIIDSAFIRALNDMLRAIPTYTDEEMRVRIVERYRRHGNIISLKSGFGIKDLMIKFNPATNFALAAKVGYYTWLDGNRQRTLMGYLMNLSTAELLDVMAKLGYTNLADSIDVFYNLLWFLIYGEKTFPNSDLQPTKQERAFISGLSSEEILAILDADYIGPRDRASLIVAAISGRVTALPDNADIANNPRYAMIAGTSTTKVWGLASKLYNIINDRGIPRDYPPHRYVALRSPDQIEGIILSVDADNIDAIFQDYGMLDYNYPGGKINFFINEIVNYGPIFSRDPGTSQPPDLKGMLSDEIEKALDVYTFRELTDAYDVAYSGESRYMYITNIAQKYRV